MEWVNRQIPPLTEKVRETALLAASQQALRHGITQVHDMGVLQQAEESWASLESLMRLRDAGTLSVRVSAALPLSERHALHARIQDIGRGCDRLQWGAVKSFVDGSLGAGTAWFLDDYAHQPGHRGAPVEALDALAQALDEAVLLGLDPVVHAIGDAATTWLTQLYLSLLVTHGDRVGQLRMEHAQHLTPSLVSQLAHPRIVLSMQPAHLLDDGPWMGRFVGPARLPHAYAFRTLLAAGARLALGSDWTVAPMDPRVALQGAVRGPHPGGAENISAEEALHAHTGDASQAAGFRDDTGVLAPGCCADFTLWDLAPFALPPELDFTEIGIKSTWVDGIQVASQDPS
jgi:predicted amidohydrolase YtcJ